MSESIALAGVVREHPRRQTLAAMTIVPGMFFAALVGSVAAGIGGFWSGLLGGLIGTVLLTLGLGARRTGATEATITRGVLRIPALDLTVRSDEIASGMDSIAGRTVVLDLKDGRIVQLYLGESDPETIRGSRGESILRALGVGSEQRTAKVPLRRMLGGFTIGLLTFLAVLFGSGTVLGMVRAILGMTSPVFVPLVMAVAATVLVVRRFGAPHCVVGTDGIRVRGMLRQPFVRYEAISVVEQRTSGEGSTLLLHLHDGSSVALPTVAIARERITALVERIDRARRRASEPRRRAAEALGRGGRALDAWREELTRLASRQATFRDAPPVDRAEVEAILEDPGASPEHRIGAAFVLSRIDPAASQAKVRVLVDTTAEDELREALLAAGSGDIESDVVERSARMARRA